MSSTLVPPQDVLASADRQTPPVRRQVSVVRRIYGNLVRLVGGKAGAGLISLAYMVIAIRVLGPADYGVLILIHTFAMTVGGLIEFPGWHAVVRYGAQATEAGDTPRLVRLLQFAALVEGIGGVCAVAVAAVLGPLLGAWLGWSPTAVAFALPYSLATLASVRATPAGFLQLKGRFDLLAVHVLVAPLVRLFGAFAILWGGGGLHAFLVLWLGAALLEWATMWLLGVYLVRRTIGGGHTLGSVRGVRSENPGLWPFMVSANADATLSDLGPRLIPLVIGGMIGPVGAALFAVAQRASTVISQPGQLLGQAGYAELAHLAAAGTSERQFRRVLLRAGLAAIAFGLAVFAIIAAAPGRISALIGGPQFAAAGSILVLVAFGRVVLVIAPLASAALVALGRPSLSVKINLVATFALLPILPFLLIRFGVAGAGWHVLLQAIVASAALMYCVLRKQPLRVAKA